MSRFAGRQLVIAIALAGALPFTAGLLGAANKDAPGREAIPGELKPATDFSKLEPGEKKPGGEATSRKSTGNKDAFSHSSGNLNFKRELNFKVGNGFFKKLWVSAPASTKASDGLGPLLNARSCQHCHLKDGRGHPPAANPPEDDAVSMFLRLSVPAKTQEQKSMLAANKIRVVPEPTYGTQLQDLSVQGHDAEGRMHIAYEEKPVELGDGETVTLREPAYTITDLAYGPLNPDTMISPRVAPPMIGIGLLEAVPEEQVMQYADPEDADGDGISGRPNRVWSRAEETVALGRFGWKAGQPSVRQQAASAFAGDIGISTPMFSRPSGDCTQSQKRCLEAPNGNTEKYQNSEAGTQVLDLVTFYARNLAVPARRNPGAPEVLAGKKLFYDIGCAGCHRPKFRTGDLPGNAHLSDQLIWPYTDLLLHDMGEGLADHRPEGGASGREWRTPPLWGIGLTETVSGHTYFLHDGRARNLTEAILWHGGEARKARDVFAALTKQERERLLAFVNSL